MTPGLNYDEHNSEPRHCPKCGNGLTSNARRTALNWEGNPEPVLMFLCLILMAFLLRESQGLTEGF